MDLISAAERLARIDRCMVTYQPGRCLLAIDKFSTCKRCVDTCPVQAIQPGSPPALVSESCVDCLACLPACPSGAFQANDQLKNLLTCLSRIKHAPVEILCAKNPLVNLAVGSGATAICIDHCLAGIGAGGFLAMASHGFDRIILRTEACPDCPLSRLSNQIESQVRQANQILEIINQSEILQCANKEELQPARERLVWEARNPPITRRDLFQMIAMSGKVSQARSLALEHHSDVREPALEHRRMVMAIRQFASESTDNSARLRDLPFAKIRVTPACTACGTCARSCPNAALEIIQDAEQLRYWLLFRPAACNGCEICSHVCGVQAIDIDHSPQFREIFGAPETELLSQGKLQSCSRCSQLYVPTNQTNLCPVCEYRRSNPFGSRLASPEQSR